MNLPGRTLPIPGPGRAAARSSALILGLLLVWHAAAPGVLGAATVRTLGGGRISANGPDAGFNDGDILQLSQFNMPFGCAADAVGRIYVADRDNGALRQLDLAANRSRTLMTGLNLPVAVVVDSASAVYVLTQGDGAVWKLDRTVTSMVTIGLAAPTAMAHDGENALFVTQDNGSVVKVNVATGSISSPVLTGLQQPGGIVVLDTGFLAVSETAGNLIRIWDPRTGQLQRQIGSGVAGFADGQAAHARFSQPRQLAKAPGGGVIVADRGNHRVRWIDGDAFATTVYGVESSSWEGPVCTSCDPMILPGWFDGSAEFAEARDPVGVAVSSNGKLYTTELYYHLVREITGVVFSGGGDGGTTNIVVLPPSLSIRSGYYPMGQVIAVSNPNSSSFLPSSVYYTTDGSEPTTNSFRVPMEGPSGTLYWEEKTRDLSSLRVKAFLGHNGSATVSGQPVSMTEIGVPQDIAAGIGSTAIIPIVVNLRTNEQLQSLQFRVEVTPDAPATPVIPETFQALSTSTNDFIPVYTGAQSTGAALFNVLPYSIGRTRGLAITFIGAEANLLMKEYGVAGLLALPIPPGARIGDRYSIEILNPSGTANASEQRVPMVSMPVRSVVVSEARYLVGDSSAATWYNAAQIDAWSGLRHGFGDGRVDNSDVNNAFAAAMGLRVPFPNTDLFDALDAFPEDTSVGAGGDGLIRFLDWQVILMRSLGLDLGRWERSWSDGGIRVPHGNGSSSWANTPGQVLRAPLPGAVWTPHASLSGEPLENVVPGATVDIPVLVHVAPDSQLAGLAFRAVLESEGTAPALERPVQFIRNPNLPAPAQSLVPSSATVLCGWPLVPSSSFDPPLRGNTLLGYVRMTVPPSARSGHVYTLRFSNADGSPDLQTQYEFETRPGSVWVLNSAGRAPDPASDQWKIHFFGSVTSESAQPGADPDRDGVPNWAEYLAGTSPIDPESRLQVQARRAGGAARLVALQWLSAPGKQYRIETAPSLAGADWKVVASQLPGDGRIQEWVHDPVQGQTSFYRIRVEP